MDTAYKSEVESSPNHMMSVRHKNTCRQEYTCAVSWSTVLLGFVFLLYMVATSLQITYMRQEVVGLKMNIQKMETQQSNDTTEQERKKRSRLMHESPSTDNVVLEVCQVKCSEKIRKRRKRRALKRCVDWCIADSTIPKQDNIASDPINVEITAVVDEESHTGSGDFAPDIKAFSEDEFTPSVQTFGSISFVQQEPALGSTFIRWGRDTCPQLSTSIYTGYAAGSYRLVNYGGSSDLECLPRQPEWNPSATSSHMTKTLLTTAKFFLGAHTDVFPALAENSAIPCAVCYVEMAVLQIPGWVDCPDGWIRQYHGYLMSSPGSTDQSFVSSRNYCVDISPRYFQGHNETNGPMLTFVQAGHCVDDSLCGRYRQQSLLSCSVCSKSS